MKFILISIGFICLFLSCSDKNNKISNNETPSQPLRSLRNVEFNDNALGVPFTQKEFLKDSIEKFTVSGSFGNMKIGFEVFLKKKNSEIIWKGVMIKSTGIESDNFIKCLSTLYNIKPSSSSFIMKDSIMLDVINLSFISKNSAEVFNMQYKLTFPESNAELNMNIDDNKMLIIFPEKDEAYRQDILNELSKP